jgi:hypothetical protein
MGARYVPFLKSDFERWLQEARSESHQLLWPWPGYQTVKLPKFKGRDIAEFVYEMELEHYRGIWLRIYTTLDRKNWFWNPELERRDYVTRERDVDSVKIVFRRESSEGGASNFASSGSRIYRTLHAGRRIKARITRHSLDGPKGALWTDLATALTVERELDGSQPDELEADELDEHGATPVHPSLGEPSQQLSGTAGPHHTSHSGTGSPYAHGALPTPVWLKTAPSYAAPPPVQPRVESVHTPVPPPPPPPTPPPPPPPPPIHAHSDLPFVECIPDSEPTFAKAPPERIGRAPLLGWLVIGMAILLAILAAKTSRYSKELAQPPVVTVEEVDAAPPTSVSTRDERKHRRLAKSSHSRQPYDASPRTGAAFAGNPSAPCPGMAGCPPRSAPARN